MSPNSIENSFTLIMRYFYSSYVYKISEISVFEGLKYVHGFGNGFTISLWMRSGFSEMIGLQVSYSLQILHSESFRGSRDTIIVGRAGTITKVIRIKGRMWDHL